MNLTEIVVASLALWRISALLSFEKGPFNIFMRFRERIGIVHDDTGLPMGVPEKYLPQLLSCVWCLSMTLAIPYIFLFVISKNVAIWLSLPFTLSTGAVLIENWIVKNG